MKRIFSIVAVSLALAGCGGGGGGNTSTIPKPTTPQIANTSLPYYLPLSNGNTWTFASGGKMVDLGSMQIACTCPANDSTMERIGLYAPGSSTLSSSFFIAKNTPAGGTQLTNLIGVENDSGTSNIELTSSTSFPYGVPIMDDSPKANETWNDGAGDASTITSVGGTMMLPNQSQVVNIAVDQITGSFSTITWGFAKGVGFTSIGVGSQSTTLISFTVNAASSYVRTADVARIAHATTGRPDVAAMLSALLK